ncbi:MAG: GNAT family N-acetyltransferase [Oligoflexales bacterium]|nr:GNAT family N-acetyltransferase [Oligoflexales bacterium]
MNLLLSLSAMPSIASEFVAKQKLLSHFLFYKRKIEIEIDKKSYVVRTASSFNDLLQVFRLRHEVFTKEYGLKRQSMGLECDFFDLNCDYIIILDKASQRVVGCYRMRCSLFTQDFYSATEFELDKFLSEPGVKVELSRACIAKDFRNGVVISLLWKGLIEYVKAANADYLFGLSSVHAEHPGDLKPMFDKIQSQDALLVDANIKPTKNYDSSYYFKERLVQSIDETEQQMEIPSLLKAYLKAGAKVHGVPAYDKDFSCFDLLTILRFADLSASFDKKYV